jgi:N-acetylglutamate synthase-like GNAT family acetyltransferase
MRLYHDRHTAECAGLQVRLGTFGYGSMLQLVNAMAAGTAALGVSELFACCLKASGIYLARCGPPLDTFQAVLNGSSQAMLGRLMCICLCAKG